MKRNEFLKALIKGAVATVILPMLPAPQKNEFKLFDHLKGKPKQGCTWTPNGSHYKDMKTDSVSGSYRIGEMIEKLRSNAL